MSRKCILYNALILLCSACALLWLLPVGSALDQQLIRPFVNVPLGFQLKKYWWYDQFAHGYLKHWLTFILVFLLVRLCLHRILPKSLQLRYRAQYATFLMMALLSMSVVSIFKHYSSHSCPWDILDQTSLQTSGIVQFLPQLGEGGCFPGGHASLGYAWLTGFFAFYPVQKRLALFYLFSGLILGTGMGWVQTMRGAHFMSHNLWTMWLCYFVGFLCHCGMLVRMQYQKRITIFSRNFKIVGESTG